MDFELSCERLNVDMRLTVTGPGEPVATAAGVLGLMSFWRCFYTAFLDFYNFRQWGKAGANKIDRVQVQSSIHFLAEVLGCYFFLKSIRFLVRQLLLHVNAMLVEDDRRQSSLSQAAIFPSPMQMH